MPDEMDSLFDTILKKKEEPKKEEVVTEAGPQIVDVQIKTTSEQGDEKSTDYEKVWRNVTVGDEVKSIEHVYNSYDECMKCKQQKWVNGMSVQCKDCDDKDELITPEVVTKEKVTIIEENVTELLENASTGAKMNDLKDIDLNFDTALANVEKEKKELAQFGGTVDDIPKNLMSTLHGKPYITKAGLLWLGKRSGVVSIKSLPIQWTWQNEQKRAVFKATVIMRDGGVYEAHGIAIPDGQNVSNPMMYKFIDVFAETRAVNRALRMATNCGYVSIEETDGYTSTEDV